MKEWNMPEIQELEVKCTEYGNSISSKIDNTWTDGAHTWFSFSDK